MRIGIVGGGQLGRMMAQEAKKMGFYVAVTDPTPDSPAGQIADKQIVADYKDKKAILELAKNIDVLTFEIELANSKILNDLVQKGIQVNPSPQTLEIIRDKLKQKEFLRLNSLPVAPFIKIENKQDLLKTAKIFGFPLVLKARFDAYDGRGNFVIKNNSDIPKALEKLNGRKLYVEKNIPFTKELAVMVARNIQGQIAVYPLVETIHKDNICHIVKIPAPVSEKIIKKAQDLARKTMKVLKGAGVFGIELFLTKKGEVIINEIAPRVHNSGHYSIEAAITSQFEQHLRAICGLPLGSTKLKVPAAVMINILGSRLGTPTLQGLEKALQIPGVSIHIYGKKEVRPQRKMGHITAVADTLPQALKNALKARKYITL